MADTNRGTAAKKGLAVPIAVAVVGLIAIGVLEDAPYRHSVERNLTSRSTHALQRAGITGASVTFDGRDGTVRVRTATDGPSALAVVRAQNGVRVVRVLVDTGSGLPGGTVPGPTPSASASPVPPGPTPSAAPTSPPAVVQKQLNALREIDFDSGSTTLTTADRATVAQVAAILRANPSARIRIDGYSDSNGTAASNLALSKARTRTVLNALAAAGIAKSRMSTAAFGEARPKVPNTTPANREINRRTDIIVTG